MLQTSSFRDTGRSEGRRGVVLKTPHVSLSGCRPLFRDAALLSELFAADMAVKTVLTFQCFMHGACARTFTVAFYAPVLNLRGKRTRQTDKHQGQAYQ